MKGTASVLGTLYGIGITGGVTVLFATLPTRGRENDVRLEVRAPPMRAANRVRRPELFNVA